ncbi:hypothetical protein RFN58_29555 [Streptomyces iakyrus]|uniref:hypothetical protein n=1 Tax=Streptomyces iakyrus TaxID=68219 RepID=UPI000525CBFB|nr:hypothetical protein [Streptomyces iakyrus]
MPDASEPAAQDLSEQRARLTTSIKLAMRPHGGKRDSLLHNGSTMAAMAATTVATVLPVDYSTWARVAAGVATFLIAVARALDFGARWRWHLNMRSRYAVLLDRVDQAALLPAGEQAGALHRIYEDLFKVRSLERGIPGVSAFSNSLPGGS